MKNNSWPEVSLGSYIDLLTGFPFKSAKYVDDPNGIRLLRGDNIVQGALRWDKCKRWTSSERRQFLKYSLEFNDVVLAMDRPWIEAGLKWAYIKESDLPCLLVQRVSRLRGKNGLLTSFLRYIISDINFTNYVKSVFTGINIPHISGQQIQAYQFHLPPVETQQKIASVLSSYDDLIENNTRRIEILEQMAKLVYEEWFVKFRFPGHKNVKTVSSELGEIPEGWVVNYLHEVAEIKYGFPFKSKLFTQESKENTPVIRIRDIINGFTMTFTSEEADEDYLVKNGDILVGMDGDFHMSRWSGGRAYLNQRVVRFRPNLKNFSWYYLYLALKPKIKYFDDTITGTTVAHLSARDINSTKLVIPSENILSKIYDILEPIHILELNLKIKNQNLRKTRDLLLPKLISGEIDVYDLDIHIRNEFQES